MSEQENTTPEQPTGDQEATTPEPTQATEATPPEEKVFTQAEVDRIVRKRAEKLVQQSLGDGYTFDDLPKLKEKITQAESDTERAIREAKEQATNEVKATYQTRAVRDAARAAAAGRWVRPEQAVLLVDLNDLDPDADDFDDEVQSRLDAYLAENPHRAVPSETPSGSTDAGSRTPPSKPGQLSRTDLSNMTPEDINKARLDGRLDELMGVKS